MAGLAEGLGRPRGSAFGQPASELMAMMTEMCVPSAGHMKRQLLLCAGCSSQRLHPKAGRQQKLVTCGKGSVRPQASARRGAMWGRRGPAGLLLNGGGVQGWVVCPPPPPPRVGAE